MFKLAFESEGMHRIKRVYQLDIPSITMNPSAFNAEGFCVVGKDIFKEERRCVFNDKEDIV